MGYRKVPTIYTLINFDGHEGLVVRMKGISFGRVRRLLTALGDDAKDQDSMDAVFKQVSDSLVSWNLEDEDGTPVPPTAEAIDDLEFDMVIAIVNKWLDQITGPGPELGKDSNSGESFPGRPLTMEAL